MTCHVRLFLAALMIAALGPPAAHGAVTVQKKPAVVEHKTFDPDDKPAEMPPLNAGELAVTVSHYDCAAEVQLLTRRGKTRDGKHALTYTVNGVRMVLGLKVVIWNPTNASEKLKAHEEGHRQISEAVYKTAEAHAKAVAEKLDGQQVTGEGATAQAARKAADEAMQAANTRVCQEYMDLTSRAGVRVQAVYDELTGHGTKPIGEKEAIQQAFAKEAEGQNRTKPATATAPATKLVRRR